jgi:hypothetical protein
VRRQPGLRAAICSPASRPDCWRPFHYYGIADESVNYREVPWRNGRFDPEQLSNKLATLARARHALREWRAKGQQRTLAFCVSTRHADYMAEQFTRAGMCAQRRLRRVIAWPRAGFGEAANGTLNVVFSVDLFNEGVDLAEHRHGDDAAAHRIEDPFSAATGPRPSPQRRASSTWSCWTSLATTKLSWAEAAGAFWRGFHLQSAGEPRIRAQGRTARR